MFRGILKGEDKTLEELGVKPNTRIMVVGSSLQEVMSLSAAPSVEEKKKLEESTSTQPLSEQLVSKCPCLGFAIDACAAAQEDHRQRCARRRR